jgi:hypothetical protein
MCLQDAGQRTGVDFQRQITFFFPMERQRITPLRYTRPYKPEKLQAVAVRQFPDRRSDVARLSLC